MLLTHTIIRLPLWITVEAVLIAGFALSFYFVKKPLTQLVTRGFAKVNFASSLVRSVDILVIEQNQLSSLDDPVWNALSTAHASFAEGNQLGKRYPVDVAPFAATRDQSAESYASLADLLGSTGTAALVSLKRPDLPAGWSFVRLVDSVQMAWNMRVPPPVEHTIVDLNASHVQEMLALTELTKPGPFSRRTPELGSYFGVREAGRLVAMAGERLRLSGYTEISAVCTHPDYRGRGYAGSLVSALIQRITRRGETPFLHVHQENIGARRLYEKLGFDLRSLMSIAVVKKKISE